MHPRIEGPPRGLADHDLLDPSATRDHRCRHEPEKRSEKENGQSEEIAHGRAAAAADAFEGEDRHEDERRHRPLEQRRDRGAAGGGEQR